MKTAYQYIRFEFKEKKPKTEVWRCLNISQGAELGLVKWFSSWRQYCFYPTGPSIYSTGCLENIRDFTDQLNKRRKGIK